MKSEHERMASAEPIPVTVVCGFLGSGKTTLLNYLLTAPHGRRIAVIVNEIGAVGIDGALVAGGERFVQLDNGCLCCALNEDLERTAHALAERGGFDHVVIETTGLADPLPVAWTFTRPGLGNIYRVDAIVTLVDAAHVARALREAPEAHEQIERADILVLNKLDLVDDGGGAAEAIVRGINANAVLLRAEQGRVPVEVLLSSRRDGAPPTDEDAASHRHEPSFTSVSVRLDATPLDERRLEDWLYALPEAVYRAKGIVNTNAPWGWTALHVVAGRVDVRPFGGAPPARAALVFIGRDLDARRLRMLCEQLTGGELPP